MSKLIILSNRVSCPKEGEDNAQGGLAVALSSALRATGGIWVGWSGGTCDTFTGQLQMHRHDGVTTATIDLTSEDVEEYYNGYANRTLWPLFHYRVDLAIFDRHFGQVYEQVNRRFAETIIPLIEDDDLLWVHDYHFLPMAKELRDAGARNPIGFFLHTPWPPHRLLIALPFHERLVKSMMGYDLIGFQDSASRDNFLDYLRTEMDADVKGNMVNVAGRRFQVGVFPIGIDPQEFSKMAATEQARSTRARLEKSAHGMSVVLGVDRLDYSKGLIERFEGYRCFLREHEEWLGKVVLLQVAPPSREAVHAYRAIREKLDEISGRVNGEYSELDWQPIRYVNRGYDRERLAGVYRASRVALVTPLRDGMNLVAKEYVAAQDPDDPGVLILSRFAGAAEQMEAALIINPHSADEMSDALDRALTMSKSERIERWRSLYDGLVEQDVHSWCETFLAELSKAGKTPPGGSNGPGERPSEDGKGPSDFRPRIELTPAG